MSRVSYLVVSYEKQAMYTTDTPEDAVTAFFREHPELTRVTVYVADYIGAFYKETVIKREPLKPPAITKPDGPNAMSTTPGPNNITPQ